ncbi:MAG: ferrous iron transport protein B [Planctomycetaceae bacterium]
MRSTRIRPARVALIGNPNTGKSTLFNALSGMRVRTGNYPGVTVEKRVGRTQWCGRDIELIDLPGTYSLSPKSPDEMVAVQVLTGCCDEPKPDLIICICNASALERNLYLATQVLEVDCPVILCLNMWDAAVHAGIHIDTESLSRELGVRVVATSATRREGLSELKTAVVESLAGSEAAGDTSYQTYPHVARILTGPVATEIDRLEELLATLGIPAAKRSPFLVARSLLDPDGSVERLLANDAGSQYSEALAESRRLLAETGNEIPGVEAGQRYRFISQMLSRVQKRTRIASATITDRIDAVLTHRVFGFLICLAVLMFVFSTIYWFSQPVSEGVEGALGWISAQIRHSMAPGPLRSLLTEGVVAGVGSVLVFLPQICLLFLFIGLLEDCGYMARAAFMMDRLMGLLGLSGRSFLPLMSSFACAVPGVMATRVIDDRRDRFVTILIAPLMSCSARLPVYVLMIGAFIPDTRLLGGWLPLRAVVLFAMSTLGLVVAVPVALLLRKTLLRGEPSPFLLELPDYRMPSLRVVLLRVWESGMSFVVRAGTLIFATSVLVWAAGSFPGDHTQQYALTAKIEALQAEDEEINAAEIEALSSQLNLQNSELLEKSLLGRMGVAIEPLVKPLGWDWRIGVGVIASFPAREVVIATLGTIYSLGGDVDEESSGLRDTLKRATWPDGTPVFSIPVAVSIMVFFALCAQCVSTLMVIRRETNSWRWPAFSFVYMTVLAYIGAFLTYQIGMRL